MTLPEPLTPADCDLRGMPFMPLEVSRLMESDLFALSTGDEFKAAIALWCRSWTQLPAASLPTDDRLLCRLAGLGLADWLEVKDMALRGFVECGDGRIYHPVIAVKALEAWEKRQSQSAKARGRWERERAMRDAVKPPKSRKNAAAHATAHAAAMQERERGESKEDSLNTCRISVPEIAATSDEAEFLRAMETAAKGAPVVEAPPPSRPNRKAARAVSDEAFAQAWAAWPRKDRSAKAKSLDLWKRHASPGEGKLRAVRAYLASKDATKDGGAFVPAFERWIRDRLDSFLEIDAAPAPKPAVSAPAPRPPLYASDDGLRFAAQMRELVGEYAVGMWLRDCEFLSAKPLRIRAPDEAVFDKLTSPRFRDPKLRALFTALAALGVEVLPPNRTPQGGPSR